MRSSVQSEDSVLAATAPPRRGSYGRDESGGGQVVLLIGAGRDGEDELERDTNRRGYAAQAAAFGLGKPAGQPQPDPGSAGGLPLERSGGITQARPPSRHRVARAGAGQTFTVVDRERIGRRAGPVYGALR